MAKTSALYFGPWVSLRIHLLKKFAKTGFRSINLLELSFYDVKKFENSYSKDNWDDWIYIIIYLSDIPVTFNWLIIVIYPIYFILYLIRNFKSVFQEKWKKMRNFKCYQRIWTDKKIKSPFERWNDAFEFEGE